jgi:PIN domain nuclease of toxin-antitoxin system
VRRRLADPANTVLLSAVVPWEVAVKRPLGKLEVHEGYVELLLDTGMVPLPVTFEHAQAVEHLPLHHRDPFDRMLVAQATVEDAAIVTRDGAFAAYGVPVVW